jgi:hypothetical protein
MTKFHQIRPWVVAVTKSSLHYTSFIVSSWFGTIPGEKNGYWGGHFWEFTSIDTVWVCVSAISTADMYSNSSDPHQRCHGSTKPFLLRRFNLVGLGKSCKVWLLWQKPMFKVSQCPLNHYRYWYIYIVVFSKKIAYSFPLNHSLPFFPYTRLVPSTFPASGVRQLYDTAVAPIVDAVSKGYNGAVIAYGQTGSGKTYSNLGPSWWL